MLTTTEKLLDNGFQGRIIHDREFETLFQGTAASRYGLIHKAREKKELVQLYRGKYILGAKYRSKLLSKFYIASTMVSGSYVSCESALSFYGWIPEKVNVVKNMLDSGRTKNFETPLGYYEYIKIPTQPYEFLSGVKRHNEGSQPFLMARPLRALMDYVYINKVDYTSLDFLTEGLRIEEDSLCQLSSEDFVEVQSVYKSKRVTRFLNELRKKCQQSSVKN